MDQIRLLDEATINKIAAGEVIERPLSIVKELVENSVDAGASAITVEIRGGGIDMIRVTDNGSGIPKDEILLAFMPHATSKIKSAEDLFSVRSLGFRGEALSTIAAVCSVEMVTKTRDSLSGVLTKLEKGKEVSFEEVGASNGTTFIARDLFASVPARRKFLKSAMTEVSYITEFIQKTAIQRSDIAFKYVVGNDNKLVTTGNGSVKDNIYRVYGREIADSVLPVEASSDGMSITGFIARPVVSRSNRSFEHFFVNGHAVKDRILEQAVESAYKPFLMQHRFPLVFLFLKLDPGMVDVNVHPRKAEVKFSLPNAVFSFVEEAVREVLKGTELLNRIELASGSESEDEREKKTESEADVVSYVVDHLKEEDPATDKEQEKSFGGFFVEKGIDEELLIKEAEAEYIITPEEKPPAATSEETGSEDVYDARQMDFVEDRMIQSSNRPDFSIIGCVFDTYWIITYKDRMIMIDQHAAHEKVMYEKFVKQYSERKVTSQYVDPPILINASGREEAVLLQYDEAFRSLGFEIERFDDASYALRAVPSGFMKLEDRDIFLGLLGELSEISDDTADVSVIHDRLAQMSCKAAVKGGNRLSLMEAEALLTDLLSLDNPYNCPHGRPTMVEFTEKDLEKFFKRIV